MPDPVTDESRYAAITRGLAERALGMAVDASPFRPAEGQLRLPMTIAVPAARLLGGVDDPDSIDAFVASLDALVQTAEAGSGPPDLTDGQGHTRPVYYLFCVHLMLSAIAAQKQAVVERVGADWADRLVAFMRPIQSMRVADDKIEDDGLASAQVNELLWRGLCELEWSLLIDCESGGMIAIHLIERVQNLTGPGGALHVQTPDDTPDAWVYRELTGLHALHLASQVARDVGWAARCGQVALYHLGHTQPDYTTYQPWGLAAFAEGESTAVFAEQQLHDVQTHLAIEGPGGALMPGLLLADASASLDGRIVGAWQRFRFQG